MEDRLNDFPNAGGLFATLTRFLPLLQNDEKGEVVIDRENDGSPEHPIHFPYIVYSDTVEQFSTAVYETIRDSGLFEMRDYMDVLREAGLDSCAAVAEADVSGLDTKTILAMMLRILRTERFCTGVLLEYLENGCIETWLERLEEIDKHSD